MFCPEGALWRRRRSRRGGGDGASSGLSLLVGDPAGGHDEGGKTE